MIVGIIGSRRRNSTSDYLNLIWKLVELEHKNNSLTEKIVTGDCSEGGDKFARKIANDSKDIELDEKKIKHPQTGEELDFEHHIYFNRYTMTGIFYRRNKEIAKEEMDYLIAIVAPDRRGGTEKTIEFFKRYHKDWEDKLVII